MNKNAEGIFVKKFCNVSELPSLDVAAVLEAVCKMIGVTNKARALLYLNHGLFCNKTTYRAAAKQFVEQAPPEQLKKLVEDSSTNIPYTVLVCGFVIERELRSVAEDDPSIIEKHTHVSNEMIRKQRLTALKNKALCHRNTA